MFNFTFIYFIYIERICFWITSFSNINKTHKIILFLHSSLIYWQHRAPTNRLHPTRCCDRSCTPHHLALASSMTVCSHVDLERPLFVQPCCLKNANDLECFFLVSRKGVICLSTYSSLRPAFRTQFFSINLDCPSGPQIL